MVLVLPGSNIRPIPEVIPIILVDYSRRTAKLLFTTLAQVYTIIMLVALPVISFLCASLLIIVFLPVRRIYTNTANLAFVLWLIFGNLIHGINSLVWAGNVDIHIPEWGDIGEH